MSATRLAQAAMATELTARLERARDAMTLEGIDALVLSDPANFFYFAGFMRPFAPWTGYIKARPFIVVVPREGRLAVLVQIPYERAGREGAPLAEIATWSSLPFRAEYLARQLSDMGLTAKRLGFEVGVGERLDFPYHEYARLRDLLPDARFADSSLVTRRARACKSDLELRWIADVHELSVAAFRKCLELASDEMDGAEIVRRAKEQLFKVGCDDVNFCRVAGRVQSTAGRLGGPRRSLESAMCLSGGGILGGYRGSVTVLGAIGGAGGLTSAQSHEANQVLGLIREELRAGQSASVVADRCQHVLDEHKRSVRLPVGGSLAHGVGLDTCEAPWISRRDQMNLQPGMVVSVGLEYETPHGWFPLRETYVVGGKVAVPVSHDSDSDERLIC